MKAFKLAIITLVILTTASIQPVDARDGSGIGGDTAPCLIETLVFYRGYNVGDKDANSGPNVSADRGRTWESMAWRDAKCFSVDVSPCGKWIYVGAGNGVFVSKDGGRNWRVTGGWRVTEVLDVRMDPGNPEKAYAITAYGFFRTSDGGETWEKPGGEQPFLYGSSLCPDRANPNKIWIGTEVGLFVSEDRGDTYRRAGVDGIVRSIEQDSRGDERFWVGTDGDGLWITNNNGRTWKQIDGAGEIVNRVVQHPRFPERIYAACNDGLRFSLDSGLTWKMGTGKDFGEDTAFYGIAFDPEDGERVYAGCRDGFYESRDKGYTWKYVSQRYAVIQDIWYGDLYVGPPEPLSDVADASWGSSEGMQIQRASDPGFEERAAIGRAALSSEKNIENPGLTTAAAVIKEGKADEKYYDALREILRKPGSAMFWSMPAITLYLYCHEELPPDINDLLRYSLVENSIYRGDTENHWVMYHTALLLSAQSWKDASEAEWYNGLSSKRNYDDAKEWLEEWFRITTTIGQGEFDSPAYYMYFIYPMLLLEQFAEDGSLRGKASMMLDLLLADFAADALDGRYCGGHSRMYDRHVRSGDGSEDGDMYYIFFGGIDPPKNFHGWSVISLYGTYRCPKAVRDIAHRRGEPYVHTEVKRVRNIFRYGDAPESPAFQYGGGMNPPVYRYDYMTPDYCLGSLQGGILQPIQQHTWDATWIGSAPNTVCFTLHPYWSGLELAMFFPEDPHMLTSSVANQKSGYTDEDKWTSSSPYERIYQLEDTLIAVYNVPESDTFPNHADLYLPKCLNHEDRGGWILGHDGDFYIGIRPLVPGEWREDEDYWRYTVPAGQAAFIVETGRKADDGEYEDFVTDMLRAGQPELEETSGGPEVKYVNRHGRGMAYIWKDDLRLMDEPVERFPVDYLYKSGLMESEYGSGVVKIFGDDVTLVLDFNKWKVAEI